jgi:hypothetical protein
MLKLSMGVWGQSFVIPDRTAQRRHLPVTSNWKDLSVYLVSSERILSRDQALHSRDLGRLASNFGIYTASGGSLPPNSTLRVRVCWLRNRIVHSRNRRFSFNSGLSRLRWFDFISHLWFNSGSFKFPLICWIYIRPISATMFPTGGRRSTCALYAL